MAANSSNIVFDDIFTIHDIDKEGKKFDRGPQTVYICSKLRDLTDTSSVSLVRQIQKL
jgi:hypothetical protein